MEDTAACAAALVLAFAGECSLRTASREILRLAGEVEQAAGAANVPSRGLVAVTKLLSDADDTERKMEAVKTIEETATALEKATADAAALLPRDSSERANQDRAQANSGLDRTALGTLGCTASRLARACQEYRQVADAILLVRRAAADAERARHAAADAERARHAAAEAERAETERAETERALHAAADAERARHATVEAERAETERARHAAAEAERAETERAWRAAAEAERARRAAAEAERAEAKRARRAAAEAERMREHQRRKDAGTTQETTSRRWWYCLEHREDPPSGRGNDIEDPLLQRPDPPTPSPTATADIELGAHGQGDDKRSGMMGYGLFGSLGLIPYLGPDKVAKKVGLLSENGRLVLQICVCLWWTLVALGVPCSAYAQTVYERGYALFSSRLGILGMNIVVILFMYCVLDVENIVALCFLLGLAFFSHAALLIMAWRHGHF